MRRFERAQLFERLCELRDLYTIRGDSDRRGVLSIEGTIAWAERLMSETPVEALSEQQSQ